MVPDNERQILPAVGRADPAAKAGEAAVKRRAERRGAGGPSPRGLKPS